MAKFSARHYEDVAHVMHNAKLRSRLRYHECSGVLQLQWQAIVDEFVDMFQRDNPRFAEELFRDACENG